MKTEGGAANETAFLVKENKRLLKVMAVLFLGVSAVAGFNVQSTEGSLGYLLIGITFFIPGLLCAWRARTANATIMRIDGGGFHYYGRRLTDWDHFVKAWYTQEDIGNSHHDNFVLFVRYRKPDGNVVQRKLPLTPSQDKSEEEILAAVRRFYRRHYGQTDNS